MLTDLRIRLRNLFRREAVDTELDEELRFHLERETEKLVRAGIPRAEAVRRSRIALGGLDQVKEECREARGVNLLETLLQDIRYALRVFRRTPVVTAVAVFSLALGIGANTAIFSLIDEVMLRFLPVQKPQELVQVRRQNPRWAGQTSATFTNPFWEQIRDHQDVFSGVFAWSEERFNLAQGGAARYVNGLFASGDYFTTLGLRPAVGRLFSPSDDRRGCPNVAVLNYGFWQDHYGGAESAVGSTLSLDNHAFQVIGVSAPGFDGVEVGYRFDVAIPVCAAAQFDGARSRLDQRAWWWLKIMGRRKPGLTAAQLHARLAVLSPQIVSDALPQNWNKQERQGFLQQLLTTVPAAEGTSLVRRRFTQPLEILMAVVALVLLIACANIASLMLARASARGREIAVRRALGASRSRLIRQLLTECVLLSAAGALAGVLFARWGNALLVRYISTSKDKVSLDFSLDARVLGFTIAVAVLTGLLFGVLPAFRATRVSLTAAMKGTQAVEGESRRPFRLGKWIVASQVACSLVLLVAAGLFLHSFAKLVALDIGFDRANVLLVSVNLKAGNVPHDRMPETFALIDGRLRALPGVVSVGRSIMTPISGYEWNNLVRVDSPRAPTGEAALVYFNFVSPAYFQTLRTPLLAGRGFDAGDTKTSPQVAVVNQTFARKFFFGANPIGQYFKVDEDQPGKPAPPVQIVGIVKDSKYESLREDTYATSFFPITQVPENDESEAFELRTATSPSSLLAAIEDSVGAVNKGISLEFRTLAQQVDDSLVQERLLARLSGFFGGLALLLAMIGLYGAISYLVAQRQIEFGIRLALGAQPGSILRLVLRDVAAILVGGVVAGISISLAAEKLVQKLLFGLAARDFVALAASAGVLCAVALLAGYLPARRAARVDPMVALRYE